MSTNLSMKRVLEALGFKIAVSSVTGDIGWSHAAVPNPEDVYRAFQDQVPENSPQNVVFNKTEHEELWVAAQKLRDQAREDRDPDRIQTAESIMSKLRLLRHGNYPKASETRRL